MSDAKTIAFYDANVERYTQMVMRAEPDADLKSFISRIPVGGKVLDIGCGPGNSAALMQAAGLQVDACDASMEMVDFARNTFGINARHESFDQLDYVDTYDGIWANFSLLHAPRAEMPNHLKRIKIALKADGFLHLGLKVGNGELRDELGRIYTYYQPQELNLLLTDAGFKPHSERFDSDGSLSMTGAMDPFMIVTAYA